jgi:hypothetical protein
MTLSSQKPRMQLLGDDYGSRRARHHGLRAVARALGLRDFVEFRRTRRRKQYTPSAGTSSLPSFATIRSVSSGRGL